MATNFPTSLDTFTNPNANDFMNVVPHNTQHDNINDAVTALEDKVGINGSSVNSSLDYIISRLSGKSPSQFPLVFTGFNEHTHVNHGLFWPKQVASVQQDLGTAFLWDMWIAPQTGSGSTGYIISDGYGGPHALLWGFTPAIITGNIWNGSATISFGGIYQAAMGEWVHAAVGWTGSIVYTYINGVPDSQTLFAGPRKSPGGQSDGVLFVGGSDHLNIACSLGFIRGWDTYNILHGLSHDTNCFVPDRFPWTLGGDTGGIHYADFLCDYTQVTKIYEDLSPFGYDSGNGLQRHHGIPGNTSGNYGANEEVPYISTQPGDTNNFAVWNAVTGVLPYHVFDSACPVGVPLGMSAAPIEKTYTPNSVPFGAKIYDSFQRANQTFAFQTHPTLGSTEGGSLGLITWNAIGPPGTSPNSCYWGLLGGKVVALGIGVAVAWVNNNSADMDVRITRFVSESGSQGTDGYTRSNGSVGLAFRVQDASNYWYWVFQAGATSPSGGNLTLAKVVAGTVTGVYSGLAVNLIGSLTLRVVTSGNTITAYYGTDGVPGTWTQATQNTDSALNSATGAGLSTRIGASTYLDGFARFLNFTVF